MRLDKLLEINKIGSRKKVKRLLLTGQVMVNGHIVRLGNLSIDPGLDKVQVATQLVTGEVHRYYMLNKPQGVVTAVSDQQHETVIDLLKKQGFDVSGLFPVGRLDRDTEGLVFITDNGQLAYELAMAKKKVVKRYHVTVNGKLTADDIFSFEKGITFLDGTTCRPASLLIQKSTPLESVALLDISEGKFHQVKKMFLAIGHKVLRLKRLSIGPIWLDDSLALGDSRHLNKSELDQLRPFFRKEENDG